MCYLTELHSSDVSLALLVLDGKGQVVRVVTGFINLEQDVLTRVAARNPESSGNFLNASFIGLP